MRISDWSSDVCSSDLLKVLALVGAVYAIVHAVRQRPDAFTAVNKLTKPLWLAILIVAALILLATSPVGLLVIIATSEARRVGTECVSTCRSRCSPDNLKLHIIFFCSKLFFIIS